MKDREINWAIACFLTGIASFFLSSIGWVPNQQGQTVMVIVIGGYSIGGAMLIMAFLHMVAASVEEK